MHRRGPSPLWPERKLNSFLKEKARSFRLYEVFTCKFYARLLYEVRQRDSA